MTYIYIINQYRTCVRDAVVRRTVRSDFHKISLRTLGEVKNDLVALEKKSISVQNFSVRAKKKNCAIKLIEINDSSLNNGSDDRTQLQFREIIAIRC